MRRTSLQRAPINFPVVQSDLPMFLQSGHIVLLHATENVISAEQSRLQQMYLKIGLNCATNEQPEPRCESHGKLIISERLYFEISSSENEVCIYLTILLL